MRGAGANPVLAARRPVTQDLLRSQVSAVHDAIVTLTPNPSDARVEPDVLMTPARGCRDHEHVNAGYPDIRGNSTHRRLEPYQLVTTGRRWYLMAYAAAWHSRRAAVKVPRTPPYRVPKLLLARGDFA